MCMPGGTGSVGGGGQDVCAQGLVCLVQVSERSDTLHKQPCFGAATCPRFLTAKRSRAAAVVCVCGSVRNLDWVASVLGGSATGDCAVLRYAAVAAAVRVRPATVRQRQHMPWCWQAQQRTLTEASIGPGQCTACVWPPEGRPCLEKAMMLAKGGVVPAGTGPMRPRAGARSAAEGGVPVTSGAL